MRPSEKCRTFTSPAVEVCCEMTISQK
jgi:hypothetical protein